MKKMWRWAFGPSIKSLTKDAAKLTDYALSRTRPPAVAEFQANLKLYIEDNPKLKTDNSPLQALTQTLFDKGYFIYIGSMYESLCLADLHPSDPMTDEKLAFLAWSGASLPNAQPNESYLAQVIRGWSNEGDEKNNFLSKIFEDNFTGAVEVFNTAVSKNAFGLNHICILTSMKKAVIQFLFPADNDVRTVSHLGVLESPGIMKDYYKLLNTPTVAGQTGETKTIEKLIQAKNATTREDDPVRGLVEAKEIISSLLQAEILDKVNPVDENTIVSRRVQQSAAPVSIVQRFTEWWNGAPAGQGDTDVMPQNDNTLTL